MKTTVQHSRPPTNVGIIPDGNRRWARQQNIHLPDAYKIAMEKLGMCITEFFKHQVQNICIYLLSLDNINRNRDDLQAVYDAEIWFLEVLLPPILKTHSAYAAHAGNKNMLPGNYVRALDHICTSNMRTNASGKKAVYLCAAYDSFDELQRATTGRHRNDKTLIENHLDVPFALDFVIRTGGEKRLSGFLLMQSKYAELVFVDYYFPEITATDINHLILEYTRRTRRFGK